MAWREARGSYRHFLFFLFSIAIGVGSIVGVGNIAANFEAMTLHEARNLLAADLEARLVRPLSEEGESVLTDLTSRGISIVRVTELIGMAMTEKAGPSQLVELKAVESGYPFYGRLKLEPAASDPFADPEGVWVQEGLLLRLGLRVGDPIHLGAARFTIRGIIKKEPDRAVGMFSLGPRVLLSQEALNRAELVRTGSRLTRRLLFKVPDASPDEVKGELKEKWSRESVRLQTYQEVQPRLTRFLDNFTTYLGLVGLVTLMIGGIGVASNVHAFLTERIRTIAILKSLGGSSTTVLLIYLFLALILGGIGSAIGVVIGIGLSSLLRSLMSGFLPPDFVFQLAFLPIFRGVAMGLLTTLLFSLRPLWIIRQTSPSRVFRQEVESEKRPFFDRANRSGFLLTALMVLGWIGLSFWQAGSWRLGGWVAGGVSLAVVLLLAAGGGTLQLIKKIPRPRSLILRYGLGNLHRPGRQIMAILLSLGIGVMILLTLAQVEGNLMAQLKQNIPQDAPSLFFIDLQPDQKKPFETMLAGWKFKKPPELTPLVRSRLYEIDGKKISEIEAEERPDGWYFTREYVLTYRKDLPEHNVIRQGSWWKEEEPGSLISVEAEAARHLGLHVGSSVTFDIQGVQVAAKVASIRNVDWGSMSTNFFFIFSPTALEGAPVTYVATAVTKPEDDLPLQNAVIRTFPNVTVIPIREVLETIAGILTEITRTVRMMALLGLLVGLVVLSGAIAATRARRVYEMVLFKTLGATRPLLIAIMAVEYTLLGLIAAAVGGALSLAVSFGIVHFLLDIPWQFAWRTLLAGGAATVLLTVVTGFLTTYRILGEKPLAVLRAE
jgi:putative ABC transport system permease protein